MYYFAASSFSQVRLGEQREKLRLLRTKQTISIQSSNMWWQKEVTDRIENVWESHIQISVQVKLIPKAPPPPPTLLPYIAKLPDKVGRGKAEYILLYFTCKI